VHRGLPLRLLALTIWMALATASVAARPADALLPDTTRGFASVPNLAALEAEFGNTQLGKLADDPAMKEFSSDLKRQFDDKLAAGYERLGLQLEDIRAMASGEVAAATVHDGNTPAGTAVLLDITGRGEEAQKHLQEVFARLKAEKFTQKTETVDGTPLEVFDRPADAAHGEAARQVVYFLKEDMLCCTDQYKLATEMLSRFVAKPSNNLAGTEAYRYVMERCQQDAGDAKPHLRWFIEPIPYALALREEAPKPKANEKAEEKEKVGAPKQDTLEIMRKEGFEGLSGVGGWVQFYPQGGKYELMHRTVLFAPGPYERAMRMVKLPNVAEFAPPTWATKNLARWSSVNLDIQNAFERSSTLFEAIIGGQPGTFDSTLKSIKNDVNGPMVDIREDIVAHLDSRVTILVDYHTPGLDDSGERRVIAIRSTDPEKLKVAIDKTMKAEHTAKAKEVAGITVWEVSPNAGPANPGPAVQGPVRPRRVAPKFPPAGSAPKPQENNVKLMQKSAVAVAHGHLFIATHSDALSEIVENPTPPGALADDPDFQEVMKQLAEVAPGESCARVFTRTSEARRVSYELFKQGKLRQSDTLFSRIVNVIMGEKPSAAEPQKVDGENLPEFEKIAPYFGPSGTSFKSEEQGFFAVGVLLKQPDAPKVEVAQEKESSEGARQ
jgi:hypothetical protein